MSVFLMLFIIWQALLGFLAVAAAIYFGLSEVGQRHGSKGLAVVFSIIAMIALGFWVWSWGSEQRTADKFLACWQEASAIPCDGRTTPQEMYDLVDEDRIGPVIEFLPVRFRLLARSPTKETDGEAIRFQKGTVTSFVLAKVFETDATMHGQADDVDYDARIRISVAKDSGLIVQVRLDDIRFK